MAFRTYPIGGIEVRRRRPRYPGEPSYSRLEFVRPKRVNPFDQWDLVRSPYAPHRGMANLDHGLLSPYGPQQQWGGGYPRPAHNRLAIDQAYHPNAHGFSPMQAGSIHGGRQWPVHDVQQHMPPPPSHHGSQRMLNFPNQRHQGGNNVWDLGQVPGDEDEDNMMPMIEPRWPRSRPRNHDFRGGGRRRRPQRYDAPMDDSDDDYSPMPRRSFGNMGHGMPMPRAFELSDDDEYGF